MIGSIFKSTWKQWFLSLRGSESVLEGESIHQQTQSEEDGNDDQKNEDSSCWAALSIN